MNTTTAFISNDLNVLPYNKIIPPQPQKVKEVIHAVGASISQNTSQTNLYRLHGLDTLSWGDATDWVRLKCIIGLLFDHSLPGLEQQSAIIKSLRGFTHIEQIESIYSLHLDKDIKTFLIDHPKTAEVVIDAFPQLKKFFGEPLRIRFKVDKEQGDENEELFAYIITNLQVENALARLNEFDDQWFINQLTNLDGDFNFNLVIP